MPKRILSRNVITLHPIISGIVPPVPPPLGTNTENPSSPNRVETIPTDNTNNTTTNNVAQNAIDKNLSQLLDSKGGSHVKNVLEFDKDDFTSRKVRFLVYLDGLEPYLLEILEDGPFVHMSSLSTFTNHLPKPHKQWSHTDRRLANQDKRLKSIIISCLPNDVMKSVIKCKTAKAIFSASPHVVVQGLLMCHLAPLSDVFAVWVYATVEGSFVLCILFGLGSWEDSGFDLKEDLRSNNEFITDLNAKYHERALLANKKRFYKRSKRINVMTKGKSEKGLVAKSFDWDKESVSSDDERVTKIKAFMAIVEDELSVGKADARSGQWVEITMKKDLGGKGKRKEKISSKEVIFTKADESSFVPIPEITSDFESECDTQEPMPPLSKLIGSEPTGTSNSLISLADLTLNTTVTKKAKQTSDKVSPAYVIKKD
ncbi:hypothetical protein Tco_1353576 [Tanacetum coccineum]